VPIKVLLTLFTEEIMLDSTQPFYQWEILSISTTFMFLQLRKSKDIRTLKLMFIMLEDTNSRLHHTPIMNSIVAAIAKAIIDQ
jgi:hypothetical protein